MEPFSSEAGVAQLGQRRKTEALIPQGFVGSNPISRTVIGSYNLSLFQSALDHMRVPDNYLALDFKHQRRH